LSSRRDESRLRAQTRRGRHWTIEKIIGTKVTPFPWVQSIPARREVYLVAARGNQHAACDAFRARAHTQWED
jgi:hypothetical protein